MALPSSGTLSIGNIFTELQNTSADFQSLSFAGQQNGSIYTASFVPINRSSTSKPDNSNPYAISEWYSYNHTQSTTCSTSPFTALGNPNTNNAMYYYRVAVTSYGSGCTTTLTLSYLGPGVSTTFSSTLKIYTSYPFSSNNTISGSPVKTVYGTSSSASDSYTHTCTGTTDYLFFTVVNNNITDPSGYWSVYPYCATPSSTYYCLGYNSGSNCAAACSDWANCGNA